MKTEPLYYKKVFPYLKRTSIAVHFLLCKPYSSRAEFFNKKAWEIKLKLYQAQYFKALVMLEQFNMLLAINTIIALSQTEKIKTEDLNSFLS